MFPKLGDGQDPFGNFGKDFNTQFNKTQNTVRIGLYAAIGFGVGLLALGAYAIHCFAH